ncbi:MAG: MGMT family protein, partial [Betaproteobacteria bacterium]|nr:MGMT family protein [Betaproteobacteria bacterium]
AVGGACASNPFAPLVPCHRVVARGGLGGFAGSTEAGGELLGIKRWLLAHERAASPAPSLFDHA